MNLQFGPVVTMVKNEFGSFSTFDQLLLPLNRI